ncbi:MAG: methyltransferase domain-containing protein [Bifidobacteriaceae bacterium]|nr:methyltransferase domain-containing protein [Bifidobacteriaceae bacterium]
MTNNIQDKDLPFAQRDIEHVPGHWLLARLGKRVLRPGGLELSHAMLDHCNITGHNVVEFAPGLGRTARDILAKNPSNYTGIERDEQAQKIVSEIVSAHNGKCINADATDTGLESDTYDVVIGEAMLSMQTHAGKAKIIAEAHRILKMGGQYAIHELGLQPDSLSDDAKEQIRKDIARAIKVNARPLTVQEWKEIAQEQGFEVEFVQIAPMALLNISRNIKDEGIGGVLKILKNIIVNPKARKRVLTMKKAFTQYRNELCGVTLVMRKIK